LLLLDSLLRYAAPDEMKMPSPSPLPSPNRAREKFKKVITGVALTVHGIYGIEHHPHNVLSSPIIVFAI
jgi:hypothetical protein